MEEGFNEFEVAALDVIQGARFHSELGRRPGFADFLELTKTCDMASTTSCEFVHALGAVDVGVDDKPARKAKAVQGVRNGGEEVFGEDSVMLKALVFSKLASFRIGTEIV